MANLKVNDLNEIQLKGLCSELLGFIKEKGLQEDITQFIEGKESKLLAAKNYGELTDIQFLKNVILNWRMDLESSEKERQRYQALSKEEEEKALQ